MIPASLLPPGWPRPKGYAMAMAGRGRIVMTGGIIGWEPDGRFLATDLAGQFDRILRTTLEVLGEAGGGPEHIVRMTWYVTSRDDYVAALPAIGAAYRRHMGRHYPAMAVVQVVALVEPEARIEIETTAILPD